MTDQSIEHLWTTLWVSRSDVNGPWLRFELGGEEFDNTIQQVPRFLQAHRRAVAVSDVVMSSSCVGVVAWNGRAPNPAGLPERMTDGFATLQATGFEAARICEWQAPLYTDDEDGEPNIWTFRSYNLNSDKVMRDTLLWHAVAAEMPIYPSAPVVTFLVNPDARVMLHVYDDRGMDLVADDPVKLREPYADFEDWLLDYDRERMATLF